MSEPVRPRPGQVTLAGWLAIAGSVLILLTVFDAMAKLQSLEVSRGIDSFLSTPPGDGLGMDVASVRSVMRLLILIGGGAAAAASVLGAYVLRGSHAARVGLTVVAVPIFLTSPVSGGMLAMLVVGASLLLWSRPARDWFAGRESAPPAPRKAATAMTEERPPEPEPQPEPQPETAPSTPDDASAYPQQPPAYPQPFGGSPQESQPQPPTYPAASYGHPPQQYAGYPPQGYAGYPPPGGPPTAPRPTAVTVACWLTWVFSGLTALAYLFVMIVLAVARQDLLDRIRQEPGISSLNITSEQLIAALWVMSIVVLVWCLSAVVLAVFTFRGAAWARVTLVVSAVIGILLSIFAIPVSIVHIAVMGTVVALLFSGDARAWFSRAQARPGARQVW